MSSQVFAVAMQKGGVGKTTTAINLAYEFSRAGSSVLLIDLDQQAHATHGLGVDVGVDEATMYEVLHQDRAERVPLRDVIKPSAFGIDVAPAAYAMRSLERTGLGSGGQMRLARELESLDAYQIVLIDCPPALGDLTVAALASADDVIATVSPGPDELDALRVLDNTVLDVQESLNPRLAIRHVLTTNYDGRSQLAKDVRRTLSTDWPDEYLGEISATVRVGEAKAFRVPVAVHASSCTAADDYRRTASTIAKRTATHVS
jgi:chromosome partitioning protein